MIFVYPAVISENVKDHMFPPVAKALEDFYLSNIIESFTSGELRLKSVYNNRKGVFGSLMLEHKNLGAQNVLLEQDAFIFTSQQAKNSIDGIMRMAQAYYYNPSNQKSVNSFQDMDKKELMDKRTDIDYNMEQLNRLKSELVEQQTAVEKGISYYKSHDAKNSEYQRFNDLSKEAQLKLRILDSNLNQLKTTKGLIESLIRNSPKDNTDDYFLKLRKDEREEAKAKNELEKWEEEQKKEQGRRLVGRGSVRIDPVTGISLKPTMVSLRTKVHYIGEPGTGLKGMRGGREGIEEEIPIGAKVVPMEIQNFENIQEVLLDDYFSTKAGSVYRKYKRKIARSLFRVIEKTVKKLTNKNVDMAKLFKDPIKRNILYSPQGFINAASFKNQPDSPSYYNFSASSVVLSHNDVTYEDGENFFMDKANMKKLFKMGWNTFVILNEVNETVYFISAIDGGALHIFPYSYLFNSLGMDRVYSSDEFQRKTRAFQKSSGNLGTLASKLNRESKLYESIKRTNI